MKLIASFALALVLLLVHESTAHPRPFIGQLFHGFVNLFHPHAHELQSQMPTIIVVPPTYPTQTYPMPQTYPMLQTHPMPQTQQPYLTDSMRQPNSMQQPYSTPPMNPMQPSPYPIY